MATEIIMKHPTTGIIKKGFYGFSWTSLFFGGFPALFRGDGLIGFLLIGLTIIISTLTAGLGNVIIGIIWGFIYNKMYTLKLIEKGYELTGTPEEISAAKSALGMI